MNTLMVVIVILAGAFSLLASVKNWDWYFNNRRARPFVRIFGRTGARIFYGLLGIFIIVVGVVAFVQS
ncbi:MAG: immunity 17 family protein [Ruminococcus sp.]|nr:immunity 17 family protein [Ruminococcus sp.]MDE6101545.1 immunity 17 family protein [Ruminococcus sp.]